MILIYTTFSRETHKEENQNTIFHFNHIYHFPSLSQHFSYISFLFSSFFNKFSFFFSKYSVVFSGKMAIFNVIWKFLFLFHFFDFSQPAKWLKLKIIFTFKRKIQSNNYHTIARTTMNTVQDQWKIKTLKIMKIIEK